MHAASLTFFLYVWLHLAPSHHENNRYFKITLSPDRVRIAYTLYFGDQPGLSVRRRMDENGNGLLSGEELEHFANAFAAEITSQLIVGVDNQIRKVDWRTPVVGTGASTVKAGSLSVDMVAILELPRGGQTHILTLQDTWALSQPGETEIYLEVDRGVDILESGMGGQSWQDRRQITLRGSTPLTRGYWVKFRTTPTEPSATAAERMPWPIWLAIAMLALVAGWIGYRRMKG